MIWERIDDPDSYVRAVLAVEAGDIPLTLITATPWRQAELALTELSIDEAIVDSHDRDLEHCRRRDRFVERIGAGLSVPPLIALGPQRRLVDGYARLRALRMLGESHASVLEQARQRVAGLIERNGHLLVVRQRARGPAGRHDGTTYLTPPGGGVEPGESLADAVAREVREEVGLVVTAAEFVSLIVHPGGSTAVLTVTVEPGEPTLGTDPDLDCDCPRIVGMQWVPAPPLSHWRGPAARSLLKLAIEDARGNCQP